MNLLIRDFKDLHISFSTKSILKLLKLQTK